MYKPLAATGAVLLVLGLILVLIGPKAAIVGGAALSGGVMALVAAMAVEGVVRGLTAELERLGRR